MAVTDRITGFSSVQLYRELGANHSFVLDDPARLFLVEKGHLDIFAAEVGEDAAIVRHRPFVARVSAGEMAFGALPPDGIGRRLHAVPSSNTTMVEYERDSVFSSQSELLQVMIWVDRWITLLSEFLVWGRGAPPRGAQLLEADPDIRYPAGSVLSTHHLDVVWVSADRPLRFLQREDLIVEPGSPVLPICENTWFDVETDAQVTAVMTPTAFHRGLIDPALDRFAALVLGQADVIADELSRDRVRRYGIAQRARQATAENVIRRLEGVLGASGEHAAFRETGGEPAQTAANLVARSMGAELESPAGASDSGETLQETVGRLARASGFQTRRITLADRWWRRDGPSFVGTAADETGEDRPLALLAGGNGGFRAVDPESGASWRVTNRNAAGIGRNGMLFYAALPDTVASGLEALVHAMHRRRDDVLTVIAMAVLGALAALLVPIATGELLAEIIPRVDIPMWIAYLAALFLGALGTAVFEIVRAVALLRIEGRADERLQTAIWSRLLSLPVRFFRGFTAGDLADRANGIAQIRLLLTGATVVGLIGGTFSLFSFVLMFYYSWMLALCAAGLLMVLAGMTWIFARGQMGHQRAAFRIQGVIDGLLFQIITGLSKLRLANAEHNALALWAERFAEQRHATFAARRWMAGQSVFNAMFTPLATLAIFAFIWYMIIDAEQQPSFDLLAFLSFNAAFGQFAAGVTGLAGAVAAAVAVIPLFERVQPILDARPETGGGRVDPGDLAGDIEFVNVAFRYRPDAPNAVDGVSFRIPSGSFTAFVGASGSGKSTVYRLLLGFEIPDSGSVMIDGHDLSSLDLPAVRSRIGVVLQNSRLMPASVFKNIEGSQTLTMEDAWEAARMVGLAEDIEAMPMGMHTVLSENNMGLSGGQMQRLMIARALARKPRILLLDEATSALDNRTQEIVQTSLNSVKVTRVVIAHRLSTVEHADTIHVLDAGRIVESGNYDQLMKRDGAFAALARRQVV